MPKRSSCAGLSRLLCGVRPSRLPCCASRRQELTRLLLAYIDHEDEAVCVTALMVGTVLTQARPMCAARSCAYNKNSSCPACSCVCFAAGNCGPHHQQRRHTVPALGRPAGPRQQSAAGPAAQDHQRATAGSSVAGQAPGHRRRAPAAAGVGGQPGRDGRLGAAVSGARAGGCWERSCMHVVLGRRSQGAAAPRVR